jgi:effector-binding domain-containing protein
VTVTTVEVSTRPTAVIAATTTWREFPALWRQLLTEVHANVRWGGPGHKGRNVMLYLDETPHVEIGVELDQPVELLGDRVTRSVLPAGRVVTTTHRGPFENLGAGHEAIARWFTEQGRTPTWPRWEIYGHHYDDPAKLTTEIYYLL